MLVRTNRRTIEEYTPVEVKMTMTVKPPNNWNPPMIQNFSHIYALTQNQDLFEELWTDNDGRSREWKRCQHYKRWLAPHTPDVSQRMPWAMLNYTEQSRYFSLPPHGDARFAYMASAPILAFGAFGNHISGLEALMVEQSDGGFLPVPVGLSELVDNSLRAMLPAMKSELSLINTLIELKDLRSLPRTLRSMQGFLENTGKRLTTAFKRLKGDRVLNRRDTHKLHKRIRKTFSNDLGPTLAEVTQTGADAYLQSEFNILPLLSDITGIQAVISRTRGRINDLIVRQGKRRIKHFTVLIQKPLSSMPSSSVSGAMNVSAFAGFTNPTGFTGYYHAPMTTIQAERSVAEYYTVFHAQVEYNYMFTQFQTENAQLLGFLDALGINLNPAIIWNAIPWSFVVDWVVDVSRWLDQYKIMNLEPTINISRYLWSTKTVRRVRVAVKGGANDNIALYGVGRFHGCYLQDLYEVAYRRDVGLPVISPLIVGELSLKKLSLGLALVLTRNRKFHKRG